MDQDWSEAQPDSGIPMIIREIHKYISDRNAVIEHHVVVGERIVGTANEDEYYGIGMMVLTNGVDKVPHEFTFLIKALNIKDAFVKYKEYYKAGAENEMKMINQRSQEEAQAEAAKIIVPGQP